MADPQQDNSNVGIEVVDRQQEEDGDYSFTFTMTMTPKQG